MYNIFTEFYREEGEKADNKMDSDLKKAVKNIESGTAEVKSEVQEVKTEVDVKHEEGQPVGQMMEGVQRVMTQNQQMALQVSLPL